VLSFTGPHNLGVKESTAKRLMNAEEQFGEIERLTKEFRKRLEEVAETVRLVAKGLNL
jgi:hypothetical protein